MKEIDFNPENFGVLGGEICWTSAICPYCEYYNSQQFVFEPEEGKTEYIEKCEKCGKKVKIVVADEVMIDKLLESSREIKREKQKTLEEVV